MKFLIGFMFLAIASAQTVIPGWTGLPAPAKGTTQIVLYSVTSAGGVSWTPVQLDMTQWKLDLSTTPPTLRLNTSPQTPVVETFTLDPATPDTVTTATFTLKFPVPAGSLILVFFHGSIAGNDYSTSVASTGGANLVVTLPTYRPFAGDKLTVAYWR